MPSHPPGGETIPAVAATIALVFSFVVGKAMCLAWLRRRARHDNQDSRRAMAKRFSLLVLMAIVICNVYL